MPAGADKGFTFDPPGAIGIVADDASVLLRLHDPDPTVRPKDEAGALDDMAPPVGAVAPQVVGAAMGQGRSFWPGLSNALSAKDLATGSSLLTRDITIMAIVMWDVAGQALAGTTGSLVCRGNSSSASEHVAYELRFAVVSAPARTGSLALSWQGITGTVHTQTAVQFSAPTGFTLITATRRWVSPTSVVCRYYIGDVLLGEVASADGDIGGGTTGTFLLGCNKAGGTALGSFFAGIVDEVAIFDRELCLEEIQDTWLRITLYQPLGVQLFRELHDPGFPMSREPSSDIQLENRQIGMGLGFAASRIENIRRNLLPQRSYGDALENWEQVLRPIRTPDRSLDARRARVLARLRQRRGCSIPGLQDLLGSLLGGADVSQLEFLAFSNTWADDFDGGIDNLRWDRAGQPVSHSLAGTAKFAPGPGDFEVADNTWATMRRSVAGDARQAHQIVKLVFTTPQSNSEAGCYFDNAGLSNRLLLGLRDLGGSFRIYTESFVGGLSQGQVEQATIGANPAAIWLHLYQTTVDGTWAASWSVTGPTTGFTAPVTITHPTVAHWAGMYLRTISPAGSGPVADFDDHLLRTPFGTSPLNAYVLLDRALGFSPDIVGARQCVDTIKHAFVHGTFITVPELVCDDPDNGCDTAPCGGF